jgi:hypothetical protein
MIISKCALFTFRAGNANSARRSANETPASLVVSLEVL